jgi:hypothetical protein
MVDLSRDTTARVERLLAGSVVAAQRVQGGYTAAARWLITPRDGQRVFAKMGTNEHTPAIPDAPRVRQVQLAQLSPALNWAARALALPAP